jgi:uncharacterized membrane protein YdjX (TVP38/TMEM64 family)/rhodanese-related sulfurtransferase
MKSGGFWLRIVLVCVLAGAVAYVWASGEYADTERFKRIIAELGSLAPLGFIVLYALGTVLFLPGSVMSAIGGAAFGPVLGTLWNLLGATLGASVAFLIARYVASAWVARKAGPRLSLLMSGIEAEGWKFVAFTRLVPVFPFNLTNYALGLTGIGVVEYAGTSFLCMAPAGAVYTYLGYAGREALAGHADAMRGGLIALGLLAALALLPRLWRSLRRTRFVEAEELRQKLNSEDPKPLVLDVRTPQEFEGPLGHVPGAKNVPLAELKAHMPELAQAKQRQVVLVCLTDERSTNAASIMLESGFKSVAVLRGGTKRWAEAGLPTERSADSSMAAVRPENPAATA